LTVFKGALIFPSSTELCWQDAWMNEDVENCYGFYIIASCFKAESQGRVKLSLFRYGSQRGLAKPLKKSSKSWLMFWSMDMVEAASP
jgi:hypothetical protein